MTKRLLIITDGQVEAFVANARGFLGQVKQPIAISIENLGCLSGGDGKIAVQAALSASAWNQNACGAFPSP